MVISQGAQAYNAILKKSKIVNNLSDFNDIKEVSNRTIQSIDHYFESKKLTNPTKNFSWEFNLIENKSPNAVCYPGGKILVHTGILQYTKNINQLATIIGHEIAHAVADHGVEKMSEYLALNVGTLAGDILTGGAFSRTRNTVGRTTGIDAYQVGILNPFSRKKEEEADYLGLAFNSLAGYELYQSVNFWKNMKKGKNGEIPQFLSTHPSSDNRISNLRRWIPEIRSKFPKIKNI